MTATPTQIEELKKLLVKNGFVKKDAIKKYTKKDNGEYHLGEGKVDSSDADVELSEDVNIKDGKYSAYLETGYPTPARRYRMILESAKANIEEPYYWVLDHLRQDQSYPYVEKVIDTYSSSEQSAMWGSIQQRLGIQQDRASQYIRGISEMIKQLFQLVRELRILDEKLTPRNNWEKSPAADMALKGEYTDLVENRGGQMQPGSIYHLAQTVGYTILPDLFFNTRVYKIEDVDKAVDKMTYNQNVKAVLKRKLYAYVNWKLKTDAELTNRKSFTLRYMRQHWNVIKMYMNWIKPYLRNIARLQMSQTTVESADIVGAFESSRIELEIICYKPSKTNKHPCILLSFNFRTRPEMSFQADQYAHKGPIHIGRVDIDFRSYAWTREEIEAYKRFRRQEDLMLLSHADTSIRDAMEYLGEDLERYLSEAGEKEFEEKKKEKKALDEKAFKAAKKESENIFGPFISIFKGFGEIGSMFALPIGKSPSSGPKSSDGKAEAGAASFDMYLAYKLYKKAHGMLSH